MNIIIDTKENPKGNWWCNTTHECMDLSEEAPTIQESREKLKSVLLKRGADEKDFVFTEPKYRKLNEPQVARPTIGYNLNRIDTAMT